MLQLIIELNRLQISIAMLLGIGRLICTFLNSNCCFGIGQMVTALFLLLNLKKNRKMWVPKYKWNSKSKTLPDSWRKAFNFDVTLRLAKNARIIDCTLTIFFTWVSNNLLIIAYQEEQSILFTLRTINLCI